MANSPIDWTKVLTHPLGLTGYVLFLLFGLLARVKRQDERRWILLVALLAAGVALFGGIGLAYRQVSHEERPTVTATPSPTPAPPQQLNEHNQLTTNGDKSPIIQGVQGGSVSVNYSDSPQPAKKQTKSKKPAQTNADQNKTP